MRKPPLITTEAIKLAILEFLSKQRVTPVEKGIVIPTRQPGQRMNPEEFSSCYGSAVNISSIIIGVGSGDCQRVQRQLSCADEAKSFTRDELINTIKHLVDNDLVPNGLIKQTRPPRGAMQYELTTAGAKVIEEKLFDGQPFVGMHWAEPSVCITADRARIVLGSVLGDDDSRIAGLVAALMRAGEREKQ